MHFLLHQFPIFYQRSWQMCHRSTQTSYSSGTLDQRLLHFPQFSMCWQTCPSIKDLAMDVSIDQVLKGLHLLHLTHWMLRDVCYKKRVLLLRLSSSGKGNSSIYDKKFTNNAGKNGLDCVPKRVYQIMAFLPLN